MTRPRLRLWYRKSCAFVIVHLQGFSFILLKKDAICFVQSHSVLKRWTCYYCIWFHLAFQSFDSSTFFAIFSLKYNSTSRPLIICWYRAYISISLIRNEQFKIWSVFHLQLNDIMKSLAFVLTTILTVI